MLCCCTSITVKCLFDILGLSMRLFYKAPAEKRPSPGPRPMSLRSMACAPAPSASLPDVAALAETFEAEVIASSADARRVLIEATLEQKTAIEAQGDVVLHVNNEYRVAAMHSRLLAATTTSTLAATGPHRYRYLVATQDGTPVSEASVVVCLKDDLTARGMTDQDGIVEFSLKFPETLNVYAYPKENYWCSAIDKSETSEDSRRLVVEPLTLPYKDSLDHFRSPGTGKESKKGLGIKVAVIDTGVDQHADLPSLVVQKTVLNGEDYEGCSDNWMAHGTHVAGIIAGSKHGVAPCAQLMGYAVFPKDASKGTAGSLDISTAIDLAVQDGAHVINLSLGWEFQGDVDVAVAESIKLAVKAGVVVVAATGNDSAERVTFPATLDEVCAVGAVAAKDKFFVSSTHRYVESRAANSMGDFVPTFSNYEKGKVQVAAPGLAVVSTTLTSGYTSMSGTSMATPVVSGLAAKLLSDNPSLLKLQGEARVSAVLELLYNGCEHYELDSEYVGAGIPTY